MSTIEIIKKTQTSTVLASKGQLAVNSPSPTTLECMSNELFMELFDLFDWYSLYFSFSSLNSRFDSVLAYCQNIQVDLDYIPSNKIMSHLGQQLPSLDPRRIKSLRSAINRHIDLVLRDDFTINHFSFIRSLTLLKIDDETAVFLFKNPIHRLRPNLVYLYMSFITSDSWRFYLSYYPKLRQCLLPNATFSSEMTYLQPNTVQSLQLSHDQSGIDMVATRLLVHSAYLRRLKLHLRQYRTDYPSPPRFVRPFSLPSSTLTHLTVQCSLLYFSSIEWLLAYCPRLRTLLVRAISSCERMVSPSEWERVLSPEIRRFDARIYVKEPATLPSELLNNNDFWPSRKWRVTNVTGPPLYLHMHS